MVSEAESRAVVEFLHREARLADEARYAEWLALWTDDGVYWVPATTDPSADPEKHLSHIYDNRSRLETRIKLLQTGYRYSQEPASPMRRLISNIEVAPAENGELVAESNFALAGLAIQARRGRPWGGGRVPESTSARAELAIQAKREMHWWVARTTHRLRRVSGELRMCRKKVVLVRSPAPLPNLSFL